MDLFSAVEPRFLTRETREALPGRFVELADGFVHYDIAGRPNGRAVVLVHGFFPHSYVWEPTFRALAEAGVCVLRYDLYGRGYSDRPDVVYDRDLYDRQLLNLLAALDINQVDLVGNSLGGAIALVFTDRHPELVRSLGLIAPSGLYPKHERLASLMRIPIVGELLIALRCRPDKFSEAKVRAHLEYRGTRRAFLSTIRHGPFGDISDVYERLGKRSRPTLLIWGKKDETIPLEVSKDVRRALPYAEFHVIKDAGHKPYLERPDLVNPLLVKFIAR